jgi:hypothetical protein
MYSLLRKNNSLDPGAAPARYNPAVTFSLWVLLALVPVWAFAYVPTQDGPSHLSNALILREWEAPGTRYHQFFELRQEPFPNWTSHLLLAGLMYFLPPLAAEKVLVSIYIIGFAYSFRYFLGSFGNSTTPLAPVVLLFVFNRCFLMGFYNYCLCLIFYWFAVGYCLRHRDGIGPLGVAQLTVTFVLAYLTHLVGFLVAAASTLGLCATLSCRRWRQLSCLAAALLPSGFLAAYYLDQAGFFNARQLARLAAGPAPTARGPNGLDGWDELASINRALFAPYEGWHIPLHLLVVLFYLGLVVVTVSAARQPPERAGLVRPRVFCAALGLVISFLYFWLPNDYGGHGSWLKMRWAPLPPLLWLACFRLPAAGRVRRSSLVLMHLLIALNLALIVRHFYAANRVLAEFTGAAGRLGVDRTIFVVQPTCGSHGLVDYLCHAVDYYCLNTHNVNLDNYEANTRYFPVRFRPGVVRGYDTFAFYDSYPQADLVDVIVMWESIPKGLLRPPREYREVYRRDLEYADSCHGLLTIFRKDPPDHSEAAGWMVTFSQAHRAWFQLTSDSLNQLRDDGVPAEVLAKLKRLIDKPFRTENELLAGLGQALPPEEMDRYQAALVKRAALPHAGVNDGGGQDTLAQLLPGRDRDTKGGNLIESQTEDGSGLVPSRAISAATDEARRKRLAPIYRYWGTARATIGLSETLPEPTAGPRERKRHLTSASALFSPPVAVSRAGCCRLIGGASPRQAAE